MASATGFSNEELLALEEFLRSCCVPIVSEQDDRLALWGTGTFFKHGETLWLITAAHILKEAPLKELAIPIAEAGKFYTFGNCTAYYPKQDEQDLDVAIIQLQDKDFCTHIAANWRIMDASQITRPTADMKRFLVAGYPRATVAKAGGIVREAFSQFYLDRYHLVPEGAHPLVDFFLIYGRTAMGVDGQEKSTPHLGGISGASIWAIQDHVEGVWAPEKQLKIVGVQSGFKHDEYIEAKSWELVEQVLARSS